MKKSVFILCAVALLGGATFLLLNKEGSDQKEATATDKTTPQTESGVQSGDTASSGGQYLPYSSETYARTEGKRILFFHASWCPQCRALDQSILSSTIPSGLTILKVDYDSNQELRKRYGVTIQTTLVQVDDNGGLVKKYTAYDSPTFSSVVDNFAL